MLQSAKATQRNERCCERLSISNLLYHRLFANETRNIMKPGEAGIAVCTTPSGSVVPLYDINIHFSRLHSHMKNMEIAVTIGYLPLMHMQSSTMP